MRIRSRRLLITFFALALGPALILLSALYAYDPLMLFHTPWGRSMTVHHNMRLQAAGVIRHGDFDSVLLGTSLFENTSADEAGRLLGGRFVNISLTAGDFFERSLVLGDLLKRRKVAEVIYSLDFIYLNQRIGFRLFPLPTFDFLYDDNPLNDIRVYLNQHFLTCLVGWSNAPECVGRPVSLDRPNAWKDDPEHAARFGGFDHWCKAADLPQMRDVQDKAATAARAIAEGEVERLTASEQQARTARAIAYVEEHVLRHVRAHPETRFHLVLPPYSRGKFALWYQDKRGDAEAHQAVVRTLVAASARWPNLVVYGWEDQDLLDDLARYKDLDHFDAGVNSLILEAIRARQHVLTPENLEAYLHEARRRAQAYDLADLAARLHACQTGHTP